MPRVLGPVGIITVQANGATVGSSALLDFVGASVSVDPVTHAIVVEFSPDTFVWNQATPAALWQVVHNLGRFPSIALVDSTGREVEADVQYISDNEVDVTFVGATGGFAYLN